MEIVYDCLPCMLRQVLEAARMSTNSKAVHEKIMEDAIAVLSGFNAYANSPELCREMHKLVKNHTGVFDPYEKIKQADIKSALELYPRLQQFLKDKQDRIYWALKTAATGNILDSAVKNTVDIQKDIGPELNRPFATGDVYIFKQQLIKAKTLLVIGDNAGETVFDRVMIEALPSLNVTYAVRSAPIINDATVKDAYASGLHQNARIIETGCAAPGAILNECSAEFLDVFYQSDIVISKGQGNFEALSGTDRKLFFLLKAKCPVIAQALNVNINEYIFAFNEFGKPSNAALKNKAEIDSCLVR